jgi:HPt (histidine-containing phosphotransfer) domain-containing protein
MDMNYAINSDNMQLMDAQFGGEAVIDKETLMELCVDLDEDEELIQEMVGLFLDDAAAQLTTARQVLASQDNAGLGRIAHTLKGSSSYYGAKRLAKPCRELEEQCERGDLSRAETLLSQMDKEFEAVKVVLRAMVFEQPLFSGATVNEQTTQVI